MDLGKLLGGVDATKISSVIDLVWDNKDDLAASLALVRAVPDLFEKLSSGLNDAGTQARAAAVALVGDDGDSGATTKLASSATTIGRIADVMNGVAGSVTDAAADVRKVPLMDKPAAKLGDAAKAIEKTTDDLGGLADDLVSLAGILAAVGAALAGLGDSLDQTGSTAKSFAAVPA